MSKTKTKQESIQHVLENEFPDGRWLRALQLFLSTGIADVRQIRRASGLSRDQVNRLLARFEKLAPSSLLVRVPFNVPRPGVRGRSPVVYRLGPLGAAILRANGHPDTRPCKLENSTAIAHAQATLDVRLGALDAGLSVHTERALYYANDQSLRPDNLVTLSSGALAVFEIEQVAEWPHLRRITSSVRNKVAFFRSKIGRKHSPLVRVIFNLPRGREWSRTVKVWERATATVAEENGGQLPFQLWATPLTTFLKQPDWNEPPDRQHWESLFDPSTIPGFDPTGTTVPQRSKKHKRAPRATRLPAQLQRHSARDDRLILNAFWQVFQEQAPLLTGDLPRPDPIFFDVMRIIYTPSHDLHADLLTQAALPHASLYLLRRYLDMHPTLKDALNKAIERSSRTIKWSLPTIFHRIQTVITAFLRYHGWRPDGPLLAYPLLSGWENDRRQSYGITVRIRHPELLMKPGDTIVPDREAIQQAEESLTWVLLSLFVYSDDLGLKRATFW
ncbi:MAG: hypothetical protein GY832_34635 [Chloroflexi bacterium]|nr:hypothetical protein [Chloroflexota bacterium]